MTGNRTLHVRVEPPEETRQEARRRVQALERGEDVEDRHVLTFENEADLARLVSPPNLRILRSIARQEPGSMRQVAELVDRDFKEVHRNLTELEALGVIELRADGAAKRPVLRYDGIEIEVQLLPDADGGGSAVV